MLKFIVSPILGFIIFTVGVFIASNLSDRSGLDGPAINPMISISIIVIAIIVTIVTYNLFPKKTVKESLSDSINYVKNTANDITEMSIKDDSELYEVAEQEVTDKNINKGLWSQALVAADGDESKRKIEYMKLRVKQLKKS
jgi:hypothetical protein